MATRESKTTSKDGSTIAFEVTGQPGQRPPLVLVDGALCYRASGPMRPLARALADHFTVFLYDRRGRGGSTNLLPSAVERSHAIDREVEDLDAIIREAGGSAFVFGVSSGAALALEAAHRQSAIPRLALYEAPFIVDDSRTPIPDGFRAKLVDAIAADRRGDAVKMFMTLVGVPSIFIALMRLMPVWSTLKGVAHTLPYDIGLVEDHERGAPLTPARWAGATVPTLVMDGGKSPAWMRNAMRSLSSVLPQATYRTLPGQTHMVKPKPQVPPLVDFFHG